MKCTALTALLALAAHVPALAQGAAPGASETPAESPQVDKIKEIVAKLKAVEAAATSVRLRMVSEGTFPGGVDFQLTGEVRVLEGTHFHIVHRFRSGEHLEGASETVRTPDGVWIREEDPGFGEVFLAIEGPAAGAPAAGSDRAPSLFAQVEAASRVLGHDREVPGAFGNRATTPLGSAMVEELDRAYALQVVGEVVGQAPLAAGERGLRIEGGLRLQDSGAAIPPVADRVALLVRERDGVVLSMQQYQAGRMLASVRIEDLVLDSPMAAESFRLDSGGRRFRSVMEHPPAAAELRQVLEEARQVRGERLGQALVAAGQSLAEVDGVEALGGLLAAAGTDGGQDGENRGWSPWEIAEARDTVEAGRERRVREMEAWLDGAGVEEPSPPAAADLGWQPWEVELARLELRWARAQAARLETWLANSGATADDFDQEAAAAALGWSEAQVREARQRLSQ